MATMSFATSTEEDLGALLAAPRAQERVGRAKRASKECLQGPTPLIAAVEAAELGSVQQLLALGANVDETITMGFSALHIAASLPGRAAIALALVRAGANVNLAANEGVAPLMAAAQHGHTDTLTVLLEAGADANQAGEEACTPLHVRRHPRTVARP